MAFFDQYDFVNAKVHGMRSRLYEADRLSSLLNCSGLPEVLQTLCPRRGDVFASDVGVEKALTEQYFQSLDQICRHMTGRSRCLIEAILLRRSLENVKVLIQFWQMSRKGDSLPGPVEAFMVSDPRVVLPPAPDLMKCETLPELFERVSLERWAPGLAETLQPAVERYEKDGVVFYVLVAVDAAYYNRLWECAAALSRRDRETALRIIGAELDIANLFAALRLRLNYRLSPEETLAVLSPHGNLLTADALETMCAAEDLGGMIERLPRPYKAIFAGVQGDFSDSEKFFWDRLCRMANRIFYESIFTIGVVLGFYVLKKIEFMNLTRVIQGFRYDLPANTIREELIPLAR